MPTNESTAGPERLAITPAPTSTDAAQEPTDKVKNAARRNVNDPAFRDRINRHADVVEHALFPTRAIKALGLSGSMSITGMRLFLARFNREAGGDESDVLFKVLTDQVAVTHQRIEKLDADVERVSSFEGKKLYLDAAAKLRSELRKMFETIAAYRREKRPNTKRSGGTTMATGDGKRAKSQKAHTKKNARRTG